MEPSISEPFLRAALLAIEPCLRVDPRSRPTMHQLMRSSLLFAPPKPFALPQLAGDAVSAMNDARNHPPEAGEDAPGAGAWAEVWPLMRPRIGARQMVDKLYKAIVREATSVLASTVFEARSRAVLEQMTGLPVFDRAAPVDRPSGYMQLNNYDAPPPQPVPAGGEASISFKLGLSDINQLLSRYHAAVLENANNNGRGNNIGDLASSGRIILFQVHRGNMVSGVLETMATVNYEGILAPIRTKYLEEYNIAQDDGGLTRDLFTEFFSQVTRKDAGFFEPSGLADACILPVAAGLPAAGTTPHPRHKQLASVGKMAIRALLEGHTVPFRLHPLALQVLLAHDLLPRRTSQQGAEAAAAAGGSASDFKLDFHLKGIDLRTIDITAVPQSSLLVLSDQVLAEVGISFSDFSLDALDTLSPAVARALFPSIPASAFFALPAPDVRSARTRYLPAPSTCSPPSAWLKTLRAADVDTPFYHSSTTLDWAPLSWVDTVGRQVVAAAAAAVSVTRANVALYIALSVVDDVIVSRFTELLAIRAGFQMVPDLLPLLQLVGPGPLQQILCGKPRLVPEEVLASFTFASNWGDSPTLSHFRRIVLEELSPKELGQLIRLCTSASSAPASGLRSVNVMRSGNTEALPVGHTCRRILDLPDYRDYRTLLKKLRISLENVDTSGFGYV